MDFGKLHNISKVNFSMPDEPIENEIVLKSDKWQLASDKLELTTNHLPLTSIKNVYIGCTGWYVKEWHGTVYPSKIKTSDYVQYYGKQFNTVELNTTHYRIPTLEEVRKWREQTPLDFRFAPKMLQAVSHSKDLGYGTGLTANFIENILHLENKLGITFLQLPPTFGYHQLKILETYLKKVAHLLPLAIEVRNENLFAQKEYSDSFFQLLEHYKVSTVITDVSGRRDVLHLRLTTPNVLIRFVGNNLDTSDYKRVDAWVEKINYWFELGLQTVYFFSHQPDNIQSPIIARYFYDKLMASMSGKFKINARCYQPVIEKTDGQMSLF